MISEDLLSSPYIEKLKDIHIYYYKCKQLTLVNHLFKKNKNGQYIFKKCYCDVTCGYRRYFIFCQFMRNAFLGKVRLNQGKVTFRLKVIKKKTARKTLYVHCPPCKIWLSYYNEKNITLSKYKRHVFKLFLYRTVQSFNMFDALITSGMDILPRFHVPFLSQP